MRSLFAKGLAAVVAASGVLAAQEASGSGPSAHLYLFPASTSADQAVPVTPADANRVLSYHLDVPGERLGPVLNDAKDQGIWSWMRDSFGQGPRAGGDFDSLLSDEKHRLVVYVDGVERPDDLLSGQTTLQPTHAVADSPSSESWTALLSSYADKLARMGESSAAAGQVLVSKLFDAALSSSHAAPDTLGKTLTLFDLSPSEAMHAFQTELSSFAAEIEQAKTHAGAAFRAMRFSSLPALKSAYGADSEQYRSALRAVGAAILSATETLKESTTKPHIAVIIASNDAPDSGSGKRDVQGLLAPFSTASKRQYSFQQGAYASDVYGSAQVAPAASLNETAYKGKCFTSKENLFNATAECSGHGDAVEKNFGGRTCYRCVCRASRTEKAATYYAGEACEKIDVSSPFILLATTTVVLLLLAAGSISYLFSEGSQDLPGTLASVSLPNIKI